MFCLEIVMKVNPETYVVGIGISTLELYMHWKIKIEIKKTNNDLQFFCSFFQDEPLMFRLNKKVNCQSLF